MNQLEQFADYLRGEDKSENTIQGYVRDLKQIMDFLDKDIAEISQEDISNYKDQLRKKRLKIKTINRKLVSLKQFIEFLNTECGYSIIVRIKQEKQQRQEYLEDMLDKHDFKKLIAAANEHNDKRARAIFYTLYYTGARVSEMLQVKVCDIKKEEIWVNGKGNKYRKLFISPKVRTAWVSYLKDRYDNSEYLFTGQRGAINRHTVHAIIKKYAKIANVSEEKAHAHNFRHLYCKNLVEKGIPIDTVADLAGHSDINTTRIYTRKTKTELMAAINEL